MCVFDTKTSQLSPNPDPCPWDKLKVGKCRESLVIGESIEPLRFTHIHMHAHAHSGHTIHMYAPYMCHSDVYIYACTHVDAHTYAAHIQHTPPHTGIHTFTPFLTIYSETYKLYLY